MKFLNSILFLVVLLSVPNFLFSQKRPVFKVVLDAGHGGKDPGKVKGKIYEKDIVLNIVLAVGKKLEKHADIKVIYTRKTDVFVDLYERGAIANREKADLFVSVHCNAHHTQVAGAETFVLGLDANDRNFEVAKTENSVIYLEDDYQKKYANYNIDSPESFIGLSIIQEEFLEQSIFLAKLLQDNFTHQMKRINRGVKQAGFIVLHQTYMPSVLIETAFLTNDDERKFLTSLQGQEDFAENIANAIVSYKEWVKNKSTHSADYPFIEVSSDKKNIKPKTKKTGSSSPRKTSVVYKVQISSSPRKLPSKPFNFKGLSPISTEKIGKLYCYFYGNAKTHKEAQNLLKNARKKGYKDAYIVAYSNGKKVSVEEAKKQEK